MNRRGLDARFFTGSLVEDLRAHAFALCPAEIHAKENGRPVLRFGAAGARLDGHDGVEVIVLAGEQCLRFQFGDVGVRGSEFAVQFLEQIILLFSVGFFLSKMNVRFDITGNRSQFFVGGNLFFGAFALAQNTLRGFLVVPESGIGDAGFEGLQALAILWRVKDSSARA